MKIETDYIGGEEIRKLLQRGKSPAEILRSMAARGLSPIEMIVQFAAAFGLPTSATTCINGWWHDGTGELQDDDVNKLLMRTIDAQRKDKAA